MISLSICIPTYNRPQLLLNSLTSIVAQEFFKQNNDIEVVISDNASDVDVGALISPLVKEFPNRIRFSRQDRAILADKNFEHAIQMANGEFVKLVNDSVIWSRGSLETLYNFVLNNLEEKPLLFVLNRTDGLHGRELTLRGLDEFVKLVSYKVTWIGGFGIWRDDFIQLADFGRYASKGLSQVDAVFRTLREKQIAYVLEEKIFDVQKTPERKNYSLSKVFGRNYIELLLENADQISALTINEEKKRVFTEHILPYHFNLNHNFFVHPLEDDLFHFRDLAGYRDSIDRARSKWLKNLKQVEFPSLAALWRHINPHNQTTLNRVCDVSVVNVGSYTYGPLNVFSWGHPREKLLIGWFCSIADDVRFILGGEHRQDTLMTYPMLVKFGGHYRESECKGEIVIKDDVWIGIGATILSGVTIGQGAVVGASSVVTRDIPAYAVVAGNPARVIKYRFPDEICEVLSKIDLRSLSHKKFTDFGPLYNTISEATLGDVLSKLELLTSNNPSPKT